jgi:hypothetical protein
LPERNDCRGKRFAVNESSGNLKAKLLSVKHLDSRTINRQKGENIQQRIVNMEIELQASIFNPLFFAPKSADLIAAKCRLRISSLFTIKLLNDP